MRGSHRRKHVIPSVGQTAGSNVASVALGACAGVIVARTLGPHDRGVFAIATVAPTFMGIVGTLGIEEAVVFLAGRSREPRSTNHLLWGSLILALLLGAIAGAISAGIQFTLFWRPGLGVNRVLFLMASLLPVQYVLVQVSFAHLRARGRYGTWNALRLFIPVIYLGCLLLTFFLGNLTVNAAIISLITGNYAVLIVALLAISTRRQQRPSISSSGLTAILSLGWRSHLITVQTYANQQLDQVFLAAMVPAVQLGKYAIAVTYASAGLSLGLAPSLQMYSHFSRSEEPDRAAYRSLVKRTLLMLVGGCVVAAVLAPFFIPLVFGKSYDGAVEPALILVLSSPLLSLSAIYSALWKSAGKPLIAAKGQGIGLLLTVLSLPIAIEYLGIVGAAGVSMVVYAAVMLWLFRSKPFDGLLESRGIPARAQGARTYSYELPAEVNHKIGRRQALSWASRLHGRGRELRTYGQQGQGRASSRWDSLSEAGSYVRGRATSAGGKGKRRVNGR
jgi:O-antigen/teichoic acid export membrane protein